MAINQAFLDNQFSSTKLPKPHTQKHPNGYLTCKLKRLLKKKIYPYANPITQVTETLEGGEAIILATIWAALQGDMKATDLIYERIEGKVAQAITGKIDHEYTVFIENMVSKAIPSRIAQYELNTN